MGGGGGGVVQNGVELNSQYIEGTGISAFFGARWRCSCQFYHTFCLCFIIGMISRLNINEKKVLYNYRIDQVRE